MEPVEHSSGRVATVRGFDQLMSLTRVDYEFNIDPGSRPSGIQLFSLADRGHAVFSPMQDQRVCAESAW
jgi:hypothetical protein